MKGILKTITSTVLVSALALGLSLTGCVLATPPVATLPDLPYEDDFSNPSSGWTRYSDEFYELYYDNGEYYIEVKEQGGTSWGGNWGWGGLTDFSLEVDARLISGTNESHCGLVFRAGDEGKDFYRFLISADGYYTIDALSGDEWMTDLHSWVKSTSIKEGTSTNHLKVVCRGSQIEVYANGHHLTTVEDILGFTQGYVGVTVGTFEPACFAFDNIVYSTPSEEQPEGSETPEQPPEVPKGPTVALPQPGEWTATTGATEFTFNFTVNSDGTGISQYTHEFTEFGYCGGYRVGKMTSEISLGEPIPINHLPSGAEFSLVDDKQVYSGQEEDPLRGIPGWIHIYWHVVIEGQFDETGTQASGTWAISSTGKERTFSPISSPPSSEGKVCQEGTWEASAP